MELERAKRAATSMICNALESKATSAEDIGRQMLTYGQRYTGPQYVDMLAQVGAAAAVLQRGGGVGGSLGRLPGSMRTTCALLTCLPAPRRLQVTAEDVVEFVQQMLATKPSLAAYGDGTEGMQREYEQLQQRYDALRGLLQQMHEQPWRRR